MVNNRNLISALYWHLNKSEMDNLNDEIMMFLLENRSRIPDESLRSLVKGSYYAQSSVSKVLAKYGLTYHETQNLIVANQLQLQMYFDSIRDRKYPSSEELAEDIIRRQTANIEMLRIIDFRQAEQMAAEICRYRRVIFMGSDFSMATINVLQSILMNMGVTCYTLYDPLGQLNITDHLTEDDMVICVSIKERWYMQNHAVIEKLLQSSCRKLLWTLKKDHQEQEQFDEVFLFGTPVNEFGYTQLSCFTTFFLQLLMKYMKQVSIGV